MLIDSDLRRDLITEAVPIGMSDPRNFSGAVILPATNQEFDTKLSAALSSGRAEMVAVPRVVTFNGKEAMIQQGIEFPAQGSADDLSANPPAKSRRVVLTLKVTPKVTANNRIDLDLDALMHDVDLTEAGESRRIVAKAEMNDRYTMALDGLLVVEKPTSDSPTINMNSLSNHRQLLVLLTPMLLPLQEPLYPAAL
jgi:type IV pilus assembly protein PilQ